MHQKRPRRQSDGPPSHRLCRFHRRYQPRQSSATPTDLEHLAQTSHASPDRVAVIGAVSAVRYPVTFRLDPGAVGRLPGAWVRHEQPEVNSSVSCLPPSQMAYRKPYARLTWRNWLGGRSKKSFSGSWILFVPSTVERSTKESPEMP